MDQILTEFFLRPMLNGLLLLYTLLFNNFGLAIIGFTVIVRMALLPLTMQQLNQAKRMTALQPKMAELRKKHKDDNQKLSQETMALYREAGVNPLGCALPMLLQLPIWIALYHSIFLVMPVEWGGGRLVPEGVARLSDLLYPFMAGLYPALPLNRDFLWLDLSRPDVYVLPILVGGSMWLQQKMAVVPGTVMDPQQASMNRMMQLILPLMFAFFTISVASGLALYWLTSNVISIVLQYFVTGWGSLVEVRAFNAIAERMPGADKRKAEAKAKPKAKPATPRAEDQPGEAAPSANGEHAAQAEPATEEAEKTGATAGRGRKRSNARGRSKRKNR